MSSFLIFQYIRSNLLMYFFETYVRSIFLFFEFIDSDLSSLQAVEKKLKFNVFDKYDYCRFYSLFGKGAATECYMLRISRPKPHICYSGSYS